MRKRDRWRPSPPLLTDGCFCPSVGDASRRALFSFVCVCVAAVSLLSHRLPFPFHPSLFFSFFPFHSFNTLRCSRLVSLSFACILAFSFSWCFSAGAFFFYLVGAFFFFWTQAILGVASHLIGAPLPLTRLDSTAHLCSLFKEPRKLTLLLKSTTFSSIISSCLYSVFFPFFFKGFLTRCFIECFCFSFSSLTTRFEALCLLCFGSLVHISPFFPFHVGFALHLLWLHPS